MAPDAISHWCDTTYLALGHFDRHGIWMRARAGAVHKHRGDRGLKEQQPCPHPWEASSNKRRNLISSSSFILTTSAAYRYSQGGDNISIRLSEGLLKRKGGGGREISGMLLSWTMFYQLWVPARTNKRHQAQDVSFSTPCPMLELYLY